MRVAGLGWLAVCLAAWVRAAAASRQPPQAAAASLVICQRPLIGRERGLALAGRASRQNSATAEAACKQQGARAPSINPRWRSGTNHCWVYSRRAVPS
jgi:hypothetical protein